MLTPLLLLGLAQTTPTFTTTDFAVAERNRLALTPKIDGRLDEEEWDPLTVGDSPSYFQWEPGVLYAAAARIPEGKAWLLSLDVNGDGWLVGADNYEILVTWGDGAPTARLRKLDATQRDAPVWEDVPYLQGLLKTAGTSEGGVWNAELKVVGTMLPTIGLGRKLGVRSDVIDASAGSPEAYVPRKTAVVELRWDRSRGLPSGMEWNPEIKLRSVPPGDVLKARFNLKNPGESALRRSTTRALGFARESTALREAPFPAFDRRGRTFIDYETVIAPEASRGYRILRTQIVGDKNEDVALETSFCVADLLEFDVRWPRDLKSKPESQVIRASVILKSQTGSRLDGRFDYSLPEGWSVSQGGDRPFMIYNPRGTTRVGLELIAPAGAKGLIPITFKATIGDKVVQETTTFVLP